jgi:O-antigen/teichoic acid export membrane protein
MIRTFIARTVRLAWMTGKRAAGTAVSLGLEKLLLMPKLIEILGKGPMGEFIEAFGWCQLLLKFPGGGVSDGLLRLYSSAATKNQWPDLLKAGLRVTWAAMGIIALAALAVMLIITPADRLTNQMVLILPLGLVGILGGIQVPMLTSLRLKLRFGLMSILEGGLGVLLLAAIPCAVWFGMRGVVATYLVAQTLVLVVGGWFVWHEISGHKTFVREWMRPVASASAAMAAVTMISMASRLAGRLALGALDAKEQVTVFFAAEAVLGMFFVPIGQVNSIIYTLVCRKRNKDEIPLSARIQHMVGCLGGSALFLVGAYFIGEFLMRTFYGVVVEQALPVFRIMLWGASVSVLHDTTRGFIFRFCTKRTILLLTGSKLVVVATPVVALTWTHGLMGAAWGTCIGSAAFGLLSFAVYLWVFILRRGSGDHPDGPPASER